MSGTTARDDLERARLAHQHTQALPEKARAKYRSIALKLPVMVHREGLAVALHFVAARGEEDQKPILDHLAAQLADAIATHRKRGAPEVPDRAALLAWVRGLDATETRRATEEVQRCLAWYKRLVQIAFAPEKDHA